MKNYLVLCLTLTLIACGPSQEELKRAEMEQQRIEKEAAEQLAAEESVRVVAVTCAVIRETRKMDSAIRVREVNNARESIGARPYTLGDETLTDAIKYGLCEDLVLDNDIVAKLEIIYEAERKLEAERKRIAAAKRAEEERIAAERRRIAAEKRAEEERIAAEKRAEEVRIAAEKRAKEERIAAEKRAEILERIRTGDYVDFYGVFLDFDLRIMHLEERQQGRNMEVGDKLLEIRSTPVDMPLISEYLDRDFTNDPSALSVTLERKGERKTRSIRIR